MAADTGALYGTVTVEEPMPTAAELAAGAELTGTPFVARALTDAAPDLLPALRAAMPDLQEIELPAGTLFAGDAPFRTRRRRYRLGRPRPGRRGGPARRHGGEQRGRPTALNPGEQSHPRRCPGWRPHL
jgi:hypothetical protein